MPGVVIDKKQMPQIAALGVLSVGVFGFFAVKIFAPPVASGATTPAPSPAAKLQAASNPASSGAASTDASGAANAVDASALIGAAPPTDNMRDPFLVAALPAAPNAAPPSPSTPPPASDPVPALPSTSEITPLPVGPADGGWSVYGVICSDDDPSAAIAIFRRGTERRYVHLGDKVDDTTRLIGVDRNGVTILASGNRVRLPLGGDQTPVETKPKTPDTQTGSFAPAINTVPLENAPAIVPPLPGASTQPAMPAQIDMKLPTAAKPI